MKIKFKPIPAFLLVLPVVIWMYNPFQLYFLNDDAIYIPRNQDFFAAEHLISRILSEFTLFVDTWLYGEKAWGFHLTNLLLHFGCTALVYVFGKRCSSAFGLAKSNETAALSSYLFFIYAFHSEAVLWIIGRGGSLSTLFAGLSLLFFLGRSKGNWQYWLSLVAFAAGLLTYEAVWMLPLLVTILVFLSKKQNPDKKERAYMLGYWMVFFLFLLVRKGLEGTVAETPYGVSDISLLLNVKRYAYNFTALFLRSFLPPSTTVLFLVSGIMLVAVLVFIVWHLAKRGLFSRFRIFIYSAFLICLLPYLMFGVDTHDSESERFLYLPSFFVCLILADFVFLIRSEKWQVFAITGLTLFHLFFLYQTSASFKQSSTIAKTTVETLRESGGAFHTVYLVDVPTQYKGAYVFRIGFEYICRWLVPSVTYNKLQKVSDREVENRVPHFSGARISREAIPLEQGQGKTIISPLNKNLNDRIFVWTDSSFVVVY